MKKIILFFIVLGICFISLPQAWADLDDGLVAYYQFNGNADDESANGNHGTVHGATLTEDRFGNPNSAYSFDGLDDYIEVPSFNALMFNEITVSVWAKRGLGVYTNNRRIFTIHDGSDPNYCYFDIEGTSLNTIAVNVDGVGLMDHEYPLEPNSWTHIAVTWDGVNVKIYKDSVLIESGLLSGSPRTGLLYLGGVDSTNYAAQIWDGEIDDLLVYDRVLSESEILQLYNYSPVINVSSGDVPALIQAINVANSTGLGTKINLEAGIYSLTAVENDTDGPNGLPSITSKITILGIDASKTFLNRDLGAPSFRIFNVQGELELKQLTISGGNGGSGGGILNSGTLSLTDCTVRDNHAGWSGAGIYNSNNAKLNILRSAVRNNTADGPGGGIRIRPEGMVTIQESSIIDNAAGVVGLWAGGGIDFDAGNLTVVNSLISGNTSSNDGAGMTMGGDTKIENSTIAFNTSSGDGGGIVTGWGGSFYIVNSTISGNEAMGNGGGIKLYESGFLKLQNTIISGNIAKMGMNWHCTSDDFGTSLGNNLIEDPSGCDITLQSTDLTGDPGLDVFTEDATPGKGHFPLLSTSTAIDKGDDAACPPTDQLGQARTDGDGDGIIICDIGADEAFISSTGESLDIGLQSGGKMTNCLCVDPASIPDDTNRPEDLIYGLIELDIEADTLGGTSIVSVSLPNPAPEEYKWYKYNSTNGWIDFSREVISGGLGDGAEFNDDRTQVILYITDNGQYDDDPADGIIKDPSGLGSSPAPATSDGDGGGGGGGCFIATLTDN